jgi:hypothetical protein
MQRKVRIADDVWNDFCASLPAGVSPSDKIRELVQGSTLNQIMGVEEAAERWNLAPGYIKNLCNSNKVHAVKIGKTWVLDKNQPNPKQSPKDAQ